MSDSTTRRFPALTISLIWLIMSVAGILIADFNEVVILFYAIVATFVGVWFLFAVWAIVPTLSLVQAIRHALAGNVKGALQWSIFPTAAIVVSMYGQIGGEVARFEVNRPAYQRVVAEAAVGKCSIDDVRRSHVAIDAIDCSGPVTIIFVWGGFGSLWNGVVYDATDQIVLPASARSASWTQRKIGRMLSCSGADRALGGHYFLASGNYVSGDRC